MNADKQAVSGIAGIPSAWSVDGSDVGIMDGHICYVSVDDGAKEIARVRLDRERAVESARLIAAGPELLDVATSMLPRNLCLTNPNIPDTTIVSLDATMGDLRKIAAAIAKALGQ